MNDRRNRDKRIDGVHRTYQNLFLGVDFGAAILFVIGSILFFYPDRQHAATWAFLVGSILFAVKPTLRVARFLHLRAIAREAETSLHGLLVERRYF
ncbi:MAG: hypothetical protein GC201_02735 [Alphaproteobacteria bacterium]|nr:hypothetical protein [Alphaproteobacteria bacterium]